MRMVEETSMMAFKWHALRTMKRADFVLLGSVVWAATVTLASTNLGRDLESEVALPILYLLRGVRPPPENVVLVKLDEKAAYALGADISVDKWPRGLHACLVQRLESMGPALVVFDVLFAGMTKAPTNSNRYRSGVMDSCGETLEGDENRSLAAAVRSAGNVLLASALWHGAGVSGAQEERRPTKMVDDAALAVGPFPLPDTGTRVGQFWSFYPGATERGDRTPPIPTLPALALQALERNSDPNRDTFHSIRHRALPPTGAKDEPRSLRQLVSERRLAAATPAPISIGEPTLTSTLAELYRGPASHYLTMYGPPGALVEVRYDDLLDSEKTDAMAKHIRGKVVFIGAAEHRTSERIDSYFTAYPSVPGQKYGGVEIMATGFANLRDGSQLRPLNWSQSAMLLAALIFLAGFSIWRWDSAQVIRAALLMLAVYGGLVLLLFERWNLWWPVMSPGCAIVSTIFAGALMQQRHLRASWREVLSVAQGYVSPQAWRFMVDRGGTGHCVDCVFGTVLVTDAANFTQVVEALGPDPRLSLGLLSEYYSTLSAPIENAEPPGLIIDTAGDGMLTVWDAVDDSPRTRLAACRAALQIQNDVHEFNQTHPSTQLPTRIGLHAGDLAIGTVDARERRFIKAVGDVTNTASRIEGLNKYLGTTLLASEATVEGLDEILLFRQCGSYLLPGKHEPVSVVEILGEKAQTNDDQKAQIESFGYVLAQYSMCRWPEARVCLEQYLDRFPGDGVARVLLENCRRNERAGRRDHSALTVVVATK
jgi:adenylate cyclase